MQFDGGCWHTVDPASLLTTSHYTNLSGEGFPYICRNEYLAEDLNKLWESEEARDASEQFRSASQDRTATSSGAQVTTERYEVVDYF